MRIKEGLVLRHIGEEHIIVDPSKGMINLANVYALNKTSVWLWEKLERKDFVLEDVIALLIDNYEVCLEKASKDAAGWITILKEQGLIVE